MIDLQKLADENKKTVLRYRLSNGNQFCSFDRFAMGTKIAGSTVAKLETKVDPKKESKTKKQ